MTELLSVLSLALSGLEVLLGGLVGYLLLLTISALVSARQAAAHTPPAAPGAARTRFAILVPAHNEERLLPALLESLGQQHYPQPLYTVYVVADNCTDRTAELVRQVQSQRPGAVFVFERFDTRQVGKGHALNWLLQQIDAPQPLSVDAFIVLDADTFVDPDFLGVMDAHLQRGESVIQGYYAVRDPGSSWNTALRFAALAVLHYLRPLGRTRLGGTAGLKGNGMCFRADLYRRFAWSGSVTEDIEYHSDLVLAGERVAFAGNAVIEAEMPATLRAAQTQNVRWESGRLQMARTYVPRLLRQAVAQKRFAPFDAAMEHLIPPTAALMALLGGCLLAGLGLRALSAKVENSAEDPPVGRRTAIRRAGGARRAVWGALGLIGGMAAYLSAGLALVKAPGRVWLALLYAPFYVVWKVFLLARVAWRVALGRQRQGWVRTER